MRESLVEDSAESETTRHKLVGQARNDDEKDVLMDDSRRWWAAVLLVQMPNAKRMKQTKSSNWKGCRNNGRSSVDGKNRQQKIISSFPTRASTQWTKTQNLIDRPKMDFRHLAELSNSEPPHGTLVCWRLSITFVSIWGLWTYSNGPWKLPTTRSISLVLATQRLNVS